MKSTLIICPHFPLPELTGANMRTMHFVRYFQRLGSVDIAHIYGKKCGSELPDPFREVLQFTLDTGGSFRHRFLRGVLSGRPLPVYRYETNSRRRLLARIESTGYDYIVARYLHTTGILWELPRRLRQRVILDFDDIISGSLSEPAHEAGAGFLKRCLLAFNRYLIRQYERGCLSFGATMVCSETDRVKLANRRRRSPFVVPNIYQPAADLAGATGDGFGLDHHLLFVGTLDYLPNVQGLRWFLECVFPEFRRVYSSARLSVVGRNPTAEVRGVCERTSGVELRVNVPDLRPFYRDARAVVVPLLAGGGTRIKILEAAASRRPVLSTPIGAEGLQLREGKEILLFRNGGEFLAKYGHLALRENYTAVVDRSQQVVATKYSSQGFHRALAPVLAQLEVRCEPASSSP